MHGRQGWVEKRYVEIGCKSGCLLVEDKRPLGIVFFNKGRIIYAATGKQAGREAVFELRGVDEGRFRFVLDKAPRNENCDLSTLGVMMDWSKGIDEAHGR